MSEKICCVFNYPPHYRKSIYQAMDAQLNCDFFFGENVPGTLKSMDVSTLKGYKKSFRNVILKGKILWQTNTLSLLFKKEYNQYLLTVDTACLSSWVFIYLAKLFGKQVFFWTHGCYGNEGVLMNVKNKLYFLPSKGLLLYSEYAKNILLKEGYLEKKLFVIANSLDYNKHLKIRPSLTVNKVYNEYFNNSNPVLIFIGRLEKKKKLSMVLDLIKELKNKVEVNCVFIGKGTDQEFLKNKTVSLGIDKNVWFYGDCYEEHEIGNLIFNADLCISPGNVGLTAIHSLSFGTPVITHSNFCNQMPEFESIEDGVNGSFFKENDIQSLTKTVHLWFVNNPVKTNDLIAKCFKVIDDKYNPNYQIKTLKKALSSYE